MVIYRVGKNKSPNNKLTLQHLYRNHNKPIQPLAKTLMEEVMMVMIPTIKLIEEKGNLLLNPQKVRSYNELNKSSKIINHYNMINHL
jgi:hypothetical protein